MPEIPEELTGLEFVSALESLADGVTIAAADGRIKYSNIAATRILGVPATGAPPSEWASYYGVFTPGTDEAFPVGEYPLVRALAGEEPENVEMVIRNPRLPADVVISCSARPLRDGTGAITGAVVVFRDVTSIKATHEELRRTNERLAESQRLKEELTAFVVHDLKNPIQAILGLAELMEDPGDADPAQIRADAGEVRAAAERLHAMVLDLLDVQLAQDGHLEPQPEVLDVAGLLADVVRTLRPRSQGIVLGAVPRDLEVQADRSLLMRLLSNLVDNCLKYGPAGGRIVLGAEAHGDDGILLSVQDEGPGVPEDLRHRIFEKYAQLERDRGGRSNTSRGLGLWFCQVAAEAHGGRIWVEDAEPVGARFCVLLPGP